MKSDEAILVIAPDAVLRRSLAFLLEAEEFHVISREAVPHQADTLELRPSCAVIDDTLVDGKEFWQRMAAVADTVVLLVDRVRELPADFPIYTIEKPLMGDALLATIRTALLRSRSSA